MRSSQARAARVAVTVGIKILGSASPLGVVVARIRTGDPRLKAETRAIGDVQAVADLLTRMVDRLRELNGAGLAAPQIGAPVKVVVVEVRKTDVFPDRRTSRR